MTQYIRAKTITKHATGAGTSAELHAITYTDTGGVARQVYPDAIYVGVAGDMDLILTGDTAAVEFKNAIAGTVYPFAFSALVVASTVESCVALSTGVNVTTRP